MTWNLVYLLHSVTYVSPTRLRRRERGGHPIHDQEAEDFKRLDATSYDPVVGAFDRYTERFSTPLARRMTQLLDAGTECRCLDVGTGTGVVALEVARGLGGGGSVVGIDLSDTMLQAAHRKAEAAGLGNRAVFERADAESIPHEDASFDAVVSLFALAHFPDPEGALKEMHRVLRPGGRIVIGVGSAAPTWAPRWWLHALRRVLALAEVRIGRRLEAPQYMEALLRRHVPGPEEHEQAHLARAGARRGRFVPTLLGDAGFVEVRSEWHPHCGYLRSADEFWELQATFSSLARKRLATASPGQLEPIRREFFDTCERVLRHGRLAYPYAAALAIGRRPPKAGP